MKEERWKQVSEIFNSALAQSGNERSRYVREICRANPSLEHEVQSLLEAHENAENNRLLNAQAPHLAATMLLEDGYSEGNSIGRYKILRKIGTGGMGDIYLARDESLDRFAAIKLLHSEFAADQDRLARFVQEAKSASQLNHPNILTVYETGVSGDSRFIATEYIEGKSLREILEGGHLPLEKALDIAEQIADALAAAHGAGIVHRDVKPENIMVRDDGLVKVVDFGLAKLAEPSVLDPSGQLSGSDQVKTTPGVILGTVRYMSPEQARGQTVDHRSDIFSFGVLLYEMLSGRHPFPGDTISDTFAAILTSEPPPLRRTAPHLPAELEGIVTRALMKNPEGRFPGAGEIKQAIHLIRDEANVGRGSVMAPSLVWKNRMWSVIAVAVLFAIVAIAAGYFYLQRDVSINSIAVLPFVNITNDPAVDYIADGVSEELINSLTELPDLRVIARTTAFRYKGTDVDPIKVGQELGVGSVLTGQVRQTGDQLEVQVDLINTSTGDQLWGESYERRVSDILAIKQDIATEITKRLQLRLSGEQRQQLATAATSNSEAYQFYLRGRYFWNKRNDQGVRKAIEEFQQALDRDPNYALGYVGLADSYIFLWDFGNADAEISLVRARQAVNKALSLDDSLAEAHATSGMIHRLQWRWGDAESDFRRAIELNPNYPIVHVWYSVYFRNVREFDRARQEARRAQELDPLSPVAAANVAYTLMLVNDVAGATDQCARFLEIEPNNPTLRELLGISYLKQQRFKDAEAEIQKAVDLTKRGNSRFLSTMGYLYAATGQVEKAKGIIKELEQLYQTDQSEGQKLAAVYVGLGDLDSAIAWLEKDFERKNPGLPEITWRVAFEGVRSDPRYVQMVTRMGLPRS